MQRLISTIASTPFKHRIASLRIEQRSHLLHFFFSVTLLRLIYSINDRHVDDDEFGRREQAHYCYHQTEHLLTGFIGAPSGQWNTSAKSSEFDNVPITRNLPGEWTAVFSLFLVASGLIEPHHTCAKLRKNNCFPLAFKPGRVSSASPFVRNHLS